MLQKLSPQPLKAPKPYLSMLEPPGCNPTKRFTVLGKKSKEIVGTIAFRIPSCCVDLWTQRSMSSQLRAIQAPLGRI